MKTYILVHGAWQASWCWQKVADELKKSGHHVITPDLPGHSSVTFNDYVTCISDIVKQAQKPVVLVGHSMAGMVISQVAENLPQHIAKLIYVTAYVPRDGDSLLSMADSLESRGLSPHLIFNRHENEISFKADTPLRELFYQQCSLTDANHAINKMHTQALEPFTATVHLTERFDSVKKCGIICTDDRIILASDQRSMYLGVITDIKEITADHAPFFSASKQLVEAITMSLYLKS